MKPQKIESTGASEHLGCALLDRLVLNMALYSLFIMTAMFTQPLLYTKNFICLFKGQNNSMK